MSAEGLRLGWRIVKFGDVVRQVKDKVDPEIAGIERYVAGDHMDTDDLRIRRWGEVGDGYLGPAFHMRFKPGQVLYGSRRTYLRKVAVPDFEGICANTTFVVESAAEDLLPDFLPYVMTSEAFHEHSIKQSKGSVNPYINFTDLKWYEFALPPLDEQTRVVELMCAVDDALQASMNVRSAAGAAWRAFAAVTFSEHLTQPLEAAVEVLLGRQRHPKYANGDHMVPYVRAANVKNGYLDLNSIYRMNFSPEEQGVYRLQSGDVLVSEGCGNIDEVGANAVWAGQLDGVVCFQKALIRLRARETTDPDLVRHWARYAFEAGLFKGIARGTSIWHISAERTRELPFPVLSTSEQEWAADQLNAVGRVELAAHKEVLLLTEMRRQLLSGPGDAA